MPARAIRSKNSGIDLASLATPYTCRAILQSHPHDFLEASWSLSFAFVIEQTRLPAALSQEIEADYIYSERKQETVTKPKGYHFSRDVHF